MYRRIEFGLMAILQLLFSPDTLAQTARMKKHFGSLTTFRSARLQRAPSATSTSAALINRRAKARGFARMLATAQMALHYAGELPHPQYNLNSAVKISNQSLVFPLRNVSFHKDLVLFTADSE